MLLKSSTRASAVLAASWLVGCAAWAAPPEGFVATTLVADLDEPVALAEAPDGRLFVAERGGRIRIVVDGAVSAEPFAEIEVYTLGECGLLGLALDPQFATNGYVYAFATVSADEQQILRLRDEDGLAAEVEVLRGNLPTAGGVHNGGALKFGPDGMLYFAIGDNGTRENSQLLATLAGKVGRLAPDGSIPEDNPFTTPSGSRRAVWALGFRNPFRMCFAADGRFFVGDVGSSGEARREELNLVTAGGNYGWPQIEGRAEASDPPGFLDPILAYAEEGSSIAGCAVYEAGAFPESYRGNLFHLDHVSGELFHAVLDADQVVSHEPFYTVGGGPVDVVVSGDGSLLVAELYTGRVTRIAYPATPTAEPAATPTPTPGAPSVPHGGLCGAGVAMALVANVLLGIRLLHPGLARTRRRAPRATGSRPALARSGR